MVAWEQLELSKMELSIDCRFVSLVLGLLDERMLWLQYNAEADDEAGNGSSQRVTAGRRRSLKSQATSQ